MFQGAFVYSRTPELPDEAIPAVYASIREAGLDPDKFCRINNKCFREPPAEHQPSTVSGGSSPASTLDRKGPLGDLGDYLENPRPFSKWQLSQQETMGDYLARSK
ncbi:hypothetical protein CYMTET_16381 [Cymbomonas tetramitiformis]|uniref:VDE lipocalin domain-containing protein n=1 Tax=Cymbomonas tetramitiformis TaxID=36881 RepID=A0AAE0L829_9CHLO|nr:hypothetical protein CYMTET_16381 [Cymbomonas tetramitiformis]